jgi:hypothetical protein
VEAAGRRGDCGNPLDAARDAFAHVASTLRQDYGRTGLLSEMVYLRRSFDEVVTHPAMPP